MVHSEHLEQLPTTLTVLDLRIASYLATLDVFEGADLPPHTLEPVPFPTLPDSITWLRIGELPHQTCVDAAKLPRSLTHFRDNRNSVSPRRFDLTDAKERLTNLTEFLVSNGRMTVDSIPLLPTSITKLQLPIKTKDLSRTDAEWFLPRSVDFRLGKGFEDIVLNSQSGSLQALSNVSEPLSSIPSSVIFLSMYLGAVSTLPQGLTQLQLFPVDDVSVFPTITGTHLTSLYMHRSPDSLIDWLPSTLVTLQAGFSTASYRALMQRVMTLTLPNITSISSIGELESDALQCWPPQLKSLSFIGLLGSLELSEDSLAQLQNSNLESLDILSTTPEATHLTRMMQSLPRSMISLSLSTKTHEPCFTAPITLPSGLKTFIMQYGAHYMEPASEVYDLILPQGLRILTLTRIRVKSIPPFLTALTIKGDKKAVDAYYSERFGRTP